MSLHVGFSCIRPDSVLGTRAKFVERRISPEESVHAASVMDFQEYLDLQPHTFVQYYRCLPISFLDRENVDEDGTRMFLPASALDRLGRLHVQYPMMFQITNPSTERVTHCSVLEFVADEGFIHMPSRLMAHLGVEENEIVLVRIASLPTATFIKLQPHSTEFLNVPDHKKVLEYNFRKFPCLTAGETIAVADGERRYYLDVLEARPADAVCSIETDCAVEFAPPLDYMEPPPKPAPAPAAPVAGQQAPPQEPPRFTGLAARMDGKPVEQPPVPTVGGQGGQQQRKPAQFTGVAMRMDGKPVELPPPTPSPAVASAGAPGLPRRKFRLPTAAGSGNGSGAKAEPAGGKEQQEKRFTGARYSFKD